MVQLQAGLPELGGEKGRLKKGDKGGHTRGEGSRREGAEGTDKEVGGEVFF